MKEYSTTDKNIDIFLNNIAYIRKVNNLSLQEMSQALGISIYYVKQMEKGILPPRLKIDVIFRIKKCFNISYKSLFIEREQ